MHWLAWLPVVHALVEQGSYRNPNPRPYQRCEAQDLIKLSQCCNDVLARLDDCKAADLACECCALQHMDPHCYNLCPGNPSTNFLTVLFEDCAPLNDVNACNLPFKKVDGQKLKAPPPKQDVDDDPDIVSVKSTVLNGGQSSLGSIDNDPGILLYSAAEHDKAAGHEAPAPKSALPKPMVVLVSSSNVSNEVLLEMDHHQQSVQERSSSRKIFSSEAVVMTAVSLFLSVLAYMVQNVMGLF